MERSHGNTNKAFVVGDTSGWLAAMLGLKVM